MTTQTADEMRVEYIRAMGPDLGVQCFLLWQELAQLHFEWNDYVELFGTKPSRIDLLNRAASTFFGSIQSSLFEDMLLHLARLTDSPATFNNMSRSNLMIRALSATVTDPLHRQELDRLVAAAVDCTKFCRDWRNRLLAHRDLDLAAGISSRPLEAATRQKVRDALASLAAVLNYLLFRFLKSETMFDRGARIHGSVSLLHVIRDGLKAGEAREQRLLRGEWTSEDRQPDI